MIDKKTVFILGAGASQPFGLPLGQELLSNVVEHLRFKPKVIDPDDIAIAPLVRRRLAGAGAGKVQLDENRHSANPFFQLLLNSGYNNQDIRLFSSNLHNSPINSVDEFLEYRTEFIEIGKRAIVYDILKHERIESLLANPDWYKYILAKMISKFDKFDQNNVGFITFNYDRSLEQYLMTSMLSLYGKTVEECHQKLSSIPIIHLHGSLGALPWQDSTNYVEYGQLPNTVQELKHSSDAIRIIHEDIEDDGPFRDAKKLLSEANAVYVLGFGYNEKNSERLGLKDIKAPLYGTMVDFTTVEMNHIKSRIPNLQANYRNMHCLKFLREQFVSV